MLTFQTEAVAQHITRIFCFNTELCYLIQGTEGAVLVDTGSGFGDLKACVNHLTAKPLKVLLTHGHVDHAMGAEQFSEVYMNRADDAVFAAHGAKAFRSNSAGMHPNPDALLAEYIPTADVNRFKELNDEDTFDLGGLHVQILGCPGHTPGSLCMLIPEKRILLLGDACNPRTFLFDEFSTGVAQYRQSLLDLKRRCDGKYDRVLLSHGSGETCSGIIESNIQTCEDILNGDVDDVPFVWNGVSYKLAKACGPDGRRLDGGIGNIVYSDETKTR